MKITITLEANGDKATDVLAALLPAIVGKNMEVSASAAPSQTSTAQPEAAPAPVEAAPVESVDKPKAKRNKGTKMVSEAVAPVEAAPVETAPVEAAPVEPATTEEVAQADASPAPTEAAPTPASALVETPAEVAEIPYDTVKDYIGKLVDAIGPEETRQWLVDNLNVASARLLQPHEYAGAIAKIEARLAQGA